MNIGGILSTIFSPFMNLNGLQRGLEYYVAVLELEFWAVATNNAECKADINSIKLQDLKDLTDSTGLLKGNLASEILGGKFDVFENSRHLAQDVLNKWESQSGINVGKININVIGIADLFASHIPAASSTVAPVETPAPAVQVPINAPGRAVEADPHAPVPILLNTTSHIQNPPTTILTPEPAPAVDDKPDLSETPIIPQIG